MAPSLSIALDIQLDQSPGLTSGWSRRRTEFLQCDAAFRFQADIDDGEFIGEGEGRGR